MMNVVGKDSPKPLHCGMKLRLYREEKVFGPGVAELLEVVADTHSLRSAAVKMNMAYSKAWKLIKTAEEGLGFRLLKTATGGRQGGGALLTPQGEWVLRQYRAFEAECKQTMEQAYVRYFGELPL